MCAKLKKQPAKRYGDARFVRDVFRAAQRNGAGSTFDPLFVSGIDVFNRGAGIRNRA